LTGPLSGSLPRPKTRGCILVGPHDFPRGQSGLDTGLDHRAPPTFTIGGRREPRTNGATCNSNAATLSSRSVTRRPYYLETLHQRPSRRFLCSV
jgi:hypothetical protein